MREAAAVRIFMAIGAQIKGDAGVLRFAIGTIGMALGALHLRVQAGERVTCPAVVKLAYIERFPVDEIVARLAIWAEPPLVKILMAGNAGGG